MEQQIVHHIGCLIIGLGNLLKAAPHTGNSGVKRDMIGAFQKRPKLVEVVPKQFCHSLVPVKVEEHSQPAAGIGQIAEIFLGQALHHRLPEHIELKGIVLKVLRGFRLHPKKQDRKAVIGEGYPVGGAEAPGGELIPAMQPSPEQGHEQVLLNQLLLPLQLLGKPFVFVQGFVHSLTNFLPLVAAVTEGHVLLFA